MLLALWNAYEDWGGGEQPPQPPATGLVGGALSPSKNRWYAYDLAEKEAKKVDEFVQEYVEELKSGSKEEELKYNAAPRILKNIGAEFLIERSVIQQAIYEAEREYQQYLAIVREIDDEAAIMLLLN